MNRLIFCLVFVFTLSSCKSERESTAYLISITDDIGTELKLEKLPRRIVSLAPNITEAFYSIGADSFIVGVTDFCDFPPDAKEKRSVGSYLSPDYETILSLKPDLVVMYVTNASGAAYNTISNNGIRIFVSNPQDIEGIKKMLSDFGRITGKQHRADSVIALIDLEASLVRDISKTDSTFIIISVNPLMTANGKTFVSQIAERSGYANIFGYLSVEYPVISAEELSNMRPEKMLFPTDTTNTEKAAESINELRKSLGTSLDSSEILMVDDDMMFRPGPRIIDAMRLLRSKH